jgi:hypothetical protein
MARTTTKPAARASRKRSPKNIPQLQPIKAAEKPNPPETGEVPEWVNETPRGQSYDLTMFEGDGDPSQDIDLTRYEFITLKRCLAALRNNGPLWLDVPINTTTIHSERPLTKRPQITQGEVQIVLDLDGAVEMLMLNLKLRLQRGAEVEPGDWSLSDDGSDCESHHVSGLGRCGLDINETAEVARRASSVPTDATA